MILDMNLSLDAIAVTLAVIATGIAIVLSNRSGRADMRRAAERDKAHLAEWRQDQRRAAERDNRHLVELLAQFGYRLEDSKERADRIEERAVERHNELMARIRALPTET